MERAVTGDGIGAEGGGGASGMSGAIAESGGGIDRQRRYFLIGATSVVGGVGIVGAAVPFVKSWTPSARARALGAPITVDISKLRPGEMLGPIPAWRGKPVFILRRSDETLQNLETQTEVLADPASENVEQQPPYARNTWRSRRPEIGVYLGICTHLGCSPKHYVGVRPEFDRTLNGGFFCPCHGSRFDLAGRVVEGVPAPDNLEVPPYSFEGDNVIVVGVDEETA